jgi:RNA polymerase-binding transcription factor
MRRSLEDAKRALTERQTKLLRRFPEKRVAEQGASRAAGAPREEAASVPEVAQERMPISAAEERELAEITAALVRVDADRYGQCESCESSVGPGRLRDIPEARLCIDCSKTRVEGHQR